MLLSNFSESYFITWVGIISRGTLKCRKGYITISLKYQSTLHQRSDLLKFQPTHYLCQKTFKMLYKLQKVFIKILTILTYSLLKLSHCQGQRNTMKPMKLLSKLLDLIPIILRHYILKPIIKNSKENMKTVIKLQNLYFNKILLILEFLISKLICFLSVANMKKPLMLQILLIKQNQIQMHSISQVNVQKNRKIIISFNVLIKLLNQIITIQRPTSIQLKYYIFFKMVLKKVFNIQIKLLAQIRNMVRLTGLNLNCYLDQINMMTL